MPKIAQPPISRFARDRESHAWWPGMIAAFLGLLLAGYGYLRATDVETVQGGLALESEVNIALAHGGINDSAKEPPPGYLTGAEPPPWANPDNPQPPPNILPRTGKSRLRIDLSAKAACPT